MAFVPKKRKQMFNSRLFTFKLEIIEKMCAKFFDLFLMFKTREKSAFVRHSYLLLFTAHLVLRL